ncbi:prephenate dehydrogenase/arogenate dehydrogenase family protein [Teichococcus vastitatis]|uniref:Prephenate dehydrogenase/arogenate dehydrogenase family protein n=1 Tax=Teichococcus vastitatis TaxID=2307076 RepID=A0ABS9W5W6_9PROT|nr:prephenate dehydrogenase/arogenate dehydrogenase family protein [Pseudoroseomonas vastitatis]MCI0754622.1 prephenate dehydrogenase/arogenate dehydrogenase family protein [Pseudoroseomonas vastitatis]
MAEPIFERLCLIGLGLIGSSIARVARERGDIARTVVACDHGVGVAARVRELDLADVVEVDAATAVQGCDGVILCTPVGSFAGLMRQIAPHLAPGTVLSDTGSTKGSVLRDVLPLLPGGVHLAPAHPMAGTEHSGPDAGFSALFQGRYVILTPLPETPADAQEKIAELWRRAGAMLETMDPATHDKVVAIVSHLPHLLAFTICSTADDLAQETREQVLKFAASGFRDFTRIASSDVDMWRDIFVNNREALLEMLARFSEDAHALGRAVRWNETQFIEDRIRRGRKIRRSLIEIKQA